MTVRHFKENEVVSVTKVMKKVDTPRGMIYIDHMIQFTNGAVVAYGDAQRQGFVWVVEAAR